MLKKIEKIKIYQFIRIKFNKMTRTSPSKKNLMVFQNTKIFFSLLPDFDQPVVPAAPVLRTAFKRYMVRAPTTSKTRTSEPECSRKKNCRCCECDAHTGGKNCGCSCCESERQHKAYQYHFDDRD